MAAFLDVCRFTPAAGGTTDWTYSAAVTGYQSPTAAGAVNGAVYRYRAESSDLSQWEIGYGAYNSGIGVFARTTVLFNSSGTTSKISFSVAPQVAIVALAEDLATFLVSAKVQKFTASGTYTPSAGMVYCIIECVGAGGGGGGVSGNSANSFCAAGGGGGSYARKTVAAATIGLSQTVTIGAGGNGGAAGSNNGGAGGDTSVGTLCIGKGGGGGFYVSTTNSGVSGGGGGVAGTGDITIPGNGGQTGMWSNVLGVVIGVGMGGAGFFGGLPLLPVVVSATATNGPSAAANSGSGGSGGNAIAVTANSAGGNGGSGFVVITEFCTQ